MLLAPNPNQEQGGSPSAATGRVYIREHTLTAGNETFSVDFSDLGLTTAPTLVEPSGAIAKTTANDANIYASYIIGSKTASAAQFTLNAPCDVTGRKMPYLVKL